MLTYTLGGPIPILPVAASPIGSKTNYLPPWPPTWIEPFTQYIFAIAAQLRADVFQQAAAHNLDRSWLYLVTLQKVMSKPSMQGVMNIVGQNPQAIPYVKARLAIDQVAVMTGQNSAWVWGVFQKVVTALPPM